MEKLNQATLTFPINLVEHRDGEGSLSPPKIEGYALTFNRESKNLGYFEPVYEVITRGALQQTDMSECVCVFNHDNNQVLGRMGVNLKLSVDDIGLRFECTPTDTSFARDVLTNMRAGVLKECSFAFTISDDGAEWQRDEKRDAYIRSVTKIDKLYDVSIVTNPAYTGTQANVRNAAQHLFKDDTPTETNVSAYLLDLELLKD